MTNRALVAVFLIVVAYVLLVAFVLLPQDERNQRACAKRGGWVSYDSGERGVCHVH